MLSTFPKEVLQNIFSYLKPEEVATLRATCEKFRISADSPVIWSPYLNRLKALDNQISVIPPKENQEGWCYRRFVEGFNQISKAQQKEIQSFCRAEHIRCILSYPHFQPKLDEIKALFKRLIVDLRYKPATTLNALEERHAILENLNALIIENRMAPNSSVLYLMNCLTRFPSSVFKPENQWYWTILTELICSANHLLRSIPVQLERCQNLRSIDCSYNSIQSVPPELGKLTQLQVLKFEHNDLITIPLTLKDKFGEAWCLNTLKCQNEILSKFNVDQALLVLSTTPSSCIITSSSISDSSQLTSGEKRTLENDTNLDEHNENQDDDDNNHSNNNSNKKPRNK